MYNRFIIGISYVSILVIYLCCHMVHRIYILILVVTGVLACASILVRNMDYYVLPNYERPFHPRYENLKPSGYESHGIGILGTAMIMAGVVLYSTRKRVKFFSRVGKIKNVLEFHIFLCLLGPMLVMYHTTFKFGGIVAVSFWSMMAVAASGIVGRYLYVQLPKGIHGNELTVKELEEESPFLDETDDEELGKKLREKEDVDDLEETKYNEIIIFPLLEPYNGDGDFDKLKKILDAIDIYLKPDSIKFKKFQEKKTAGKKPAVQFFIPKLSAVSAICLNTKPLHSLSKTLPFKKTLASSV